jgi:signal transduction histidine kinase/GAF domain-containing protein
LTSFAQLGAIRLGTERALISLFDKSHQHVVAEATPTLSLIGGRFRDDRERLRLGCCVLPKERGFCHHVEGLPSPQYTEQDEIVGEDSLVVLDVKENERFNSPDLLNALSDVRFYAAVPLISPRGFTIGAYSVMDSEPRTSTLDQNHLQFMKDMATTVMEHLTREHASQKNRQAERMIVGLGSFVEGRSTLRDSWREANAQYAASEQSGGSTEGQLNIQQQNLQQQAKDQAEKSLAFRNQPRKSSNGSRSRPETREQGTNHMQPPKTQPLKTQPDEPGNSVRSVLAGESLQDDTMSNSVKQVFSRAANLIRESIGAEGVMFLDANSERFGSLVKPNSRKVSGPASKEPVSSSDESTDSASSAKQHNTDGESENTLVSECLGFSSSRISSIDDEARAGQSVVVPEPLFSSLIRRYPRGKIFTFNANGAVSEDSDSSRHQSEHNPRANTGGTRAEEQRAVRKKRRKPTFQQDASNLIKIFANARNILLLPIWDSNNRRWFAGTLVWTNDPEHIFTFENELVYVSAFTNSIMAEIRRVDVELAEKAKTNLVSSITHELRNPLHGILGTADILSDTAMNALQHGMVHTIESCGRTLLDTINNLLDLTFIDKYQKKVPRSERKRAEKQTSTSANSKDSSPAQTKERGESLTNSHVELDAVLEEVAECVFAGYSFYTNPQAPPPALTDSSSRSAGPTSQCDTVGPRASQVTIIFDIQPDTEWDFNTHAGAWRRILMNVFGNALKYTTSGYIYLGLSSSQRDKSKHLQSQDGNEFEVTLTVKDTGKGIGPKYLHDGLFTPFSQENPLAPGSGLGLSIVRQAVGFLGGSIEIESTQGVGTTLTIRTPLTRASEPSDISSSSAMFSSLLKYTEGKKVGFLGFGKSIQSQRDTSLYSSLERLCQDWFGLESTNVSPTEGQQQEYDFYLAVQTELDSESTEGRNLFGISQYLVNTKGRASPVVVICQSPEEAHKLFVSARNRNETLYFEFISQPCGPRKLARALDICLQRQGSDYTGRQSAEEPTRWVEMPQSSHLPVDIGPSDPPEDRMKISKRPTADTMGSPDGGSGNDHYFFNEETSIGNKEDTPPPPHDDHTKTPEPLVLLVDDNELNLQLLRAYTKKDGHQYMTATNGAEAVDIYKSHPGKFRVVIIGKHLRSDRY